MLTGMALVEAIRHGEAQPPSGIVTLGLDRTHHWLTTLEPGHAVLRWDVDDQYLNLEGAVICSWITAVGDQALFFACTSLCGEGEGTRMAEMTTRMMQNVGDGELVIDARIVRRVDDRMFGTCTFSRDGDPVAELVATIDVIPPR